jgi:hypothetical protein
MQLMGKNKLSIAVVLKWDRTADTAIEQIKK